MEDVESVHAIIIRAKLQLSADPEPVTSKFGLTAVWQDEPLKTPTNYRIFEVL